MKWVRNARNRKVLTLSVTSLLAVAVTGCGDDSGLVKGVDLSTPVIENEVYMRVDVTLKTGGLQMPSVEFPITDNGKEIGFVGLQWGGSDKTNLYTAINVVKAADVDECANPTLPNGSSIPVSTEGAFVTCLPVSGATTAYFGLGDQTALVGAAVNIREIQKLSKYVGGFNIFTPFNIGEVPGVAGIYTGTEGGIAVFVDASSLLEDLAVGVPPVESGLALSESKSSLLQAHSSNLLAASSLAQKSYGTRKEWSFKKQGYSRNERKRKRVMDRKLNRMQRKRTKMHSG